MPDDVRTYRMIALSPVHIGSGNRLAPEDYDMEDRDLVRFAATTVLRAMKPELRDKVEQNLMSGRFHDALRDLRNCFRAIQKQTRSAGRRSLAELYRVRLCPLAFQGLQGAIENPNRAGEVHALQRNPYHWRVTIPGSAIKGAMRTALLNHFVNPPTGPDPAIHRRIEEAKARRRGDVAVEEEGFTYQKSRTEQDVMRMVEVADAEWPASEVVVSKASLEKLSRSSETTAGMQLHVERLRCQADMPLETVSTDIHIQLNLQAQSDSRVRLGRRINWESLTDACNLFFANRFNAEMQTFQSLLGNTMGWRPELRPGHILLRVGRHCHFDSLSVDHLRETRNARTGHPIREIGSTRTLCELENGGTAPFGWVLLERTS